MFQAPIKDGNFQVEQETFMQSSTFSWTTCLSVSDNNNIDNDLIFSAESKVIEVCVLLPMIYCLLQLQTCHYMLVYFILYIISLYSTFLFYDMT